MDRRGSCVHHGLSHCGYRVADHDDWERAAATAWAEGRKQSLLESRADGLMADLRGGPPAAQDLATYLGPHRGHTDHLGRLKEGRSIGSGMVEGACKTAVGKRLKQTGARWRYRRVEHMAALCCLEYSQRWDAYWQQTAG